MATVGGIKEVSIYGFTGEHQAVIHPETGL